MVSTFARDYGKQLVDQKRVSINRINDAVRRILRIKYRAGLFAHPYVNVAQAQAKQLLPANRAAARRAAGRSMVLLKNDGNALPLSTSKSTAVIGPLGNDKHDMLGPWWGRGDDDKDIVDVFSGIDAQSPGATYAQGCQLTHDEAPDYKEENDCGSDAGFAQAVATAESADQVVLALGETRARWR